MGEEKREFRVSLETGLKHLGSDWVLWFSAGDKAFVCAKKKGSDFECAQIGARPAEAVNKVLEAMEKEKAEIVDRYCQSKKS